MIEEVVKIGKRGQITLPSGIRESENLNEGDFVELSDLGGVITMRKIEKKPSVLDLFAEVGKALKKEGYSKQTSIKLADEVKKEVSG